MFILVHFNHLNLFILEIFLKVSKLQYKCKGILFNYSKEEYLSECKDKFVTFYNIT